MNTRIVYTQGNGTIAVVIPTGESSIEDVILKDLPDGVEYEIVDADDIPSDRTFREAWVIGDGHIDCDLDKCKTIGHAMRRTAREAEFKPHDDVISKQIPGNDAIAAEAARQLIRNKYSDIQDAIDAAKTPDEIKLALDQGHHQPKP